MIKDHTRDYVTAMFRIWAQSNKKRNRDNVDDAALLDIAAVSQTFKQLEKSDKGYIVEAVKAVYCTLPEYELSRGSITDRVRRHALAVPCSEKQVYEWLKCARLMCAKNRGLRL